MITQGRKPRSGTVVSRRREGRTIWSARILLKDGTRAQLQCPIGATRDEAKALARKWQSREDETRGLFTERQRQRGGHVDGEIADAWFERMLPLRAAAKQTKDSPELATRWRTWVSPTIGAKPLVAVTREDLLTIRDTLDAAIVATRLAPKTAVNVWSCVRTVFRVACSTKGWAKSLRVLETDPTIGIEPVDDGPSRKRQWVYPSEFAKLMECEGVPVERRYLYACAVYTGLRPEELVELRWKDVDFVAGLIRVGRAFDWKSKQVGTPKTHESIRDVPIDPHLFPALMQRAGKPDEYVTPRFNDDKAAPTFRADLKEAGVLSHRLFEKTATHLPIDFRSLRDSFATWHAHAGLELQKLMRRMGHKDYATTLRYAKAAESLSANVGAPFGPLPWAPPKVTESVTTFGSFEEKQRRGWDSNPR
jgi:integrase